MRVEECKQGPGDDTDADRVATYWHDYELVPMAANLQLVFYTDGKDGLRGSQKDEVLIRLLLNEHDAHLPIEAISGCFYRWKDVELLWKIQ